MRSQRAMVVAALLGALQAGWSVFQWRELLELRRGGEAFCFGGGDGCATVWSSPLASAVQSATGVPVAGWGVVWGLVAAALPLWIGWLRGQGRPTGAASSASLLTAAAGTATVIGLAASLFFAGTVCSTCAVTYVLVLAYAVTIFFFSEAPNSHEWAKGATLAAGATGAAYLALLYPGLQTPPSASATLATVEPGGELGMWVEQLAPPLRQELANALASFSMMRAEEREPAVGALLGPADAPVRITEFSDILCSHCANLHQALERLRSALPRGRISIEARFFPLDGACNPLIPSRAEDPVRCTAPRALICVEDPEQSFALAGTLFAERNLNEDLVKRSAQRYRPLADLEDCMASENTAARLQRDIEEARALDIRGTPLVLVNGRIGSAYPLFLYAIAMAEGRTDHPAFASLPAPQLLDPHRGHGH